MRKPFDELTIVDDYMFYLVMQDMKFCKPLLNMLLGHETCTITDIGLQKSFDSASYAKGIRLDIWAKDVAGTVYDIEMQAVNQHTPTQSIGVCCSHKVVAVGFNTLCYDAECRGIKPSARIKKILQSGAAIIKEQ